MAFKINNIAEKIIDFRNNRKYSGTINSVRFNDISSDLNACLICLPSKLDLVKPAAEILPQLAKTFVNRDIRVIITTNIDPQSHEIIKRFTMIKPQSYDLDRFSLPKRKFIDRITEGGVAVAIDMDTSPNLFNALVCLKGGAKIRTTFDKGVGLPYYNFILGIPSVDVAPKVSYRAMADILGNF